MDPDDPFPFQRHPQHVFTLKGDLERIIKAGCPDLEYPGIHGKDAGK